MALPFVLADLNPATADLLRKLDLLTGRLEHAVTALEDTLDPEPAEPAEREPDD
jgi:hypothetical protein